MSALDGGSQDGLSHRHCQGSSSPPSLTTPSTFDAPTLLRASLCRPDPSLETPTPSARDSTADTGRRTLRIRSASTASSTGRSSPSLVLMRLARHPSSESYARREAGKGGGKGRQETLCPVHGLLPGIATRHLVRFDKSALLSVPPPLSCRDRCLQIPSRPDVLTTGSPSYSCYTDPLPCRTASATHPGESVLRGSDMKQSSPGPFRTCASPSPVWLVVLATSSYASGDAR